MSLEEVEFGYPWTTSSRGSKAVCSVPLKNKGWLPFFMITTRHGHWTHDRRDKQSLNLSLLFLMALLRFGDNSRRSDLEQWNCKQDSIDDRLYSPYFSLPQESLSFFFYTTHASMYLRFFRLALPSQSSLEFPVVKHFCFEVNSWCLCGEYGEA